MKVGAVGQCADCGRRRPLASRGRCTTCYAKLRQQLGKCTNCGERRPLYARGECKPCRDAFYRGYR
jgi:hypothetical protein